MKMKSIGCSLVAVLMLALYASRGHAAMINNFFSLRGTTATTLSGTGNTDDPRLGTTSTTGAGARMMGYFPERELVNVGSSIKLKFSLSFADGTTSIANASDNFRFALYDRNGEAQEPTNSNFNTVGTINTNAFRGYWYGVDTNPNPTGVQGTIRERSAQATEQDPFANASAALIGAPGGTAVSFALGETYTGRMTLTLTGANEITLSGTFIDSGGGANTFSLVDTSPVTKKFSVVGFLNGGNISADQVNFKNIEIVPEPASWMLGILALGMGAYARRRRVKTANVNISVGTF